MTAAALPSPRMLAAAMIAGVMAGAFPAGAQVVQRPPREYRGVFGGPPLDPNRPHQEVTLRGSLLGSHEDGLTPGSTGTPDPFAPAVSGFAGVGDLRGRYWRGREAQAIEVSGGGYVNSFRGLGLTPIYGGDARAAWNTSMGRRHQFALTQDITFAPMYGVPTFLSPQNSPATATVPVGDGTSGYAPRQSKSLSGTASVVRQWSRHAGTTIAAGYGNTTFEDGLGDTRSYNGSVDFSRTLGRRSSMSLAYRFSQGTTAGVGGVAPRTGDQTVTGSYSREVRLSPTRQFALAVGGGSTRVSTDSRTYWTPSGYLSLRQDWARSWSVWLDYNRSVAVLEGLTPDPYMVDSLMLRTGGYLAPRLELSLTGSWANGRQGAEIPAAFDSYSAITQVRFVANRWYSIVASHTLYAHRMQAVEGLPPGFQSSFERQAIRLGFTLDMPVRGRYVDQTRP